MATSTTRLGLTKPDYVDVVDIADLNNNANKLDAAVGFTICTSTTRPSTPWSGQVIFETNTGLSFVWDGSSWKPAGGSGSIKIAATAPSSPQNGDLWWDSDNGNLYIYYDDGSGAQWVAANGPQVFVGTAAPSGYQGQLWFDSTQGKTYIYYDDGTSAQWVSAIGGSLAGNVIQVVSTTKTDTFSTTSTTMTDITGLSATITPRSTSSKIYVVADVSQGQSTLNARVAFQLVRGSTNIAQGDAAGTRLRATMKSVLGGNADSTAADSIQMAGINFLDSPGTTSSTTYKLQMAVQSGTGYVNRAHTDADTTGVISARTVSTITLMEIAG